jgi:large subunit ribosomal protein L13
LSNILKLKNSKLIGGKTMGTFIATPSTIEKKWYIVDAEGQTLGRLAAQVASVLRGKNKPTYTPFLDCGDYVIIVNAEKIAVTGKKLEQKIYRSHSRYVGSMKETTLKDLKNNKPEKVLEYAIKGMLPHGALGRQMYKKLFVYAGAEHNHQAQKPEELKLAY